MPFTVTFQSYLVVEEHHMYAPYHSTRELAISLFLENRQWFSMTLVDSEGVLRFTAKRS